MNIAMFSDAWLPTHDGCVTSIIKYREALEKEAWELIENQADKKFAEWIKNYHNIEQVKIEATLRP